MGACSSLPKPLQQLAVVRIESKGRFQLRGGLVGFSLPGQRRREQQAVIKPLGRLFHGIRGVSGSTILGNGRVALVLDVPALCGEAIRRSTELVSQ